jgi:hypothetical protein
MLGMAQPTRIESNADHDKIAKLDVGTIIPVRVNETIDVDRSDISAATVLAHPITRVYRGMVDSDVRGKNGHLAIPKGSNVELMVRVSRDNGLLLDLESTVISGQRYAVRAAALREDSTVSEIMPELTTGQVSGKAVNVPRDSVVTFRLKRPLEVGIKDRGSDRDGIHYHGQ